LADQFLVEDAKGRILSALMLIPWTWRYADVELPVGEMGIVGTAADFRRKGLVSALVTPFMKRLRERGCLLSIIQGIPGFYDRYGYSYALPLEGGARLEYHQIPDAPQTGHSVRAATSDDLAYLMDAYAESVNELAIHTVRDEATWRYMLAPYAIPDAGTRRTMILEDSSGRRAGYFRLPDFHFGRELVVDEVSRLGYEACMATLRFLKQLGSEQGMPFIRLNVPESCDLQRVARAFGSVDMGRYSWQIYVPDAAALLRAVVRVLNRRLADSLFAGVTTDFHLSFYRAALSLRIEDGALVDVSDLHSPQGDADAAMPLHAFVSLFLGWRNLDELRAVHPDVNARDRSRLLLDALFPPMQSFIYMPY
jgi:hypothetical protein